MNEVLKVENLTVVYPGYTFPAVESVNFSIKQGTITAIIGPNGSGKTTLLKAILGLIDYKGEIKVFGKPIKEMYRDIGFVPQRFTFDPTFPITVYEFISIALSGFGEDSNKHKGHIRESLKSVDAAELVDRKLSTLSGGQLQRILLARALVHRPKLLLLDEPESGVDVGGEQTFYDLIEKMVKSDRMTVLISSHELDVVYAYSDFVLCLNRVLVCNGVPKKVLDQETFEKLYGRGLKFYAHEHHH